MSRALLTLTLLLACRPALAGDGWRATLWVPSHGCSGVAVAEHDVLTAAHPFAGEAASRPVVVASEPAGAAWLGRLVLVDRRRDVALVRVEARLPFVAPLAAGDGEPRESCGHDGMGPLVRQAVERAGRGAAPGSDPDWLVATRQAPGGGRSGGPLLDAAGDVVGVCHGRGPAGGYFVSWASVRRALGPAR